jgi:hypothetical protein
MKLKNTYTCLLLAALCGAGLPARAQDPASLYFMNVIPQATHLNPAIQPRGNVFVSLPSMSLNFHSDLAIKDLLQQHGGKWYSPIETQFDYGLLRGAIGKKSTMFNIDSEIDILGFGFRTKKGYFSFGISEHITMLSTIPSDLFKIPEAALDNASLDFSPLRIKAMLYKQISIGYSHAINDKLTVGANLKPIFGQAALSVKMKKFALKTSANEWSVDIKGDMHASAPITMTEKKDGDKNDFPDIETKDLESSDYVSNYGTSLSNPGLAVDLGATYKYSEWFTFSAALNNLGFISWKDDANGLSVGGRYTFNGIEYSTGDDSDDAFDQFSDTLKNILNYDTNHERFTTSLPPVLYLGAACNLTQSISVGLLSRSTFWRKGYRQNFSLSLNLQPYTFVALNLGVNQQIKGNTYFSGGFSLFLGPLQFYLLTDYAPVRYSTATIDGNEMPFVPERQKEVILRTGLNLVFGRKGYVSRPSLSKLKNDWL